MSYSILRVEKVKNANAIRAIQRHNQRENKNYSNKDIDLTKSHLNYDLINAKPIYLLKNGRTMQEDWKINYIEKIEERIAEGYKGKRKIRKDAIKLVDGIITSDKKFFDKLSKREQEQFFKESLEFLKQEYGEENIIYATVHLDEKTPHMHFGFVPLTKDGRLSAKEILGNKKAMSELQDRFNEFINEKGYNLERGEKATGRKHLEVQEFKLKTLQEKTQQMESQLKKYRSEFEKLKKVDAQIRHIEDIEKKAVFKEKGLLKKESTVTLPKEDFELYSRVAKAGFAYYEKYEELKKSNSEVIQMLESENKQLEEERDSLLHRNIQLSRENKALKQEIKGLKREVQRYKNYVKTFTDQLTIHMKKLAKALQTDKLFEAFKKHVLEPAKVHSEREFKRDKAEKENELTLNP
jgi:hypothetical protein